MTHVDQPSPAAVRLDIKKVRLALGFEKVKKTALAV
jgi:hypothetical protein